MVRIVLTPGEPAGIGPDLTVAIAQQPLPYELVVIADPKLLAARAEQLRLPLSITDYGGDGHGGPHSPGQLTVLPVPLARPVAPGTPDSANADSILAGLKRAVRGCLDSEFAAMVTGPVHKASINQAGHPFSGHTEFIAAECGTARPVMMLMNRNLRVALATTHIPLSAVPAAITRDVFRHTLEVVHRDLCARFGIAAPRLLVCGLNPHAGEEGYLGREEIDIMAPVLEELRRAGLDLVGPVPADTAFTPDSLKGMDAVIAMYHDQGLPPLKAGGFGDIVNITLGLPIIRTSVDHGTAFPLAGSGRARPDSLLAALDCAGRLARRTAAA